MDFRSSIHRHENILMEGALGERLKREYGLKIDGPVAMADLIYDDKGADALRRIWEEYIGIARRHGLPFMATTPTRRANRERVANAGYTGQLLQDNVQFLKSILSDSGIETYAGGLMGCRGDAYTGEGALSECEAEDFHSWAAEGFCRAGADFLYAGIMPVLSEAAGLARAADCTGLPYIISFTIRQDGRLIDGTPIADAIRYIDRRTHNRPVCYMANCVHPRIVRAALMQPFNDIPLVKARFMGIQANTSPLSYEELDGSEDLKCSEPEEFAEEMQRLSGVAPLRIWGGCCGTDHRHMESIARRLVHR